jgi:hypothetical protein
VGAFYRVRANSLSRQNRANFIHYCFVNAQEIEASWRRRNVLTSARMKTLRSLWRHVAVSALVDALPDFEAARKKLNAAGGHDFALDAGWLLRTMLGPQAASRVARAELQRRERRRAGGRSSHEPTPKAPARA